jgi:two-component system alkaline phosphatase synthesis response regulator PhoP
VSLIRVVPLESYLIIIYPDMEKEYSILIVEDDISIIDGLEINLKREGYKVLTASHGQTGYSMASKEKIDLLLLDIMLPGLNGFEICRKIKKEKPGLPVIMLTAKSEETDMISGLDYGADDYITKPFSLTELFARIRSVLRRSGLKTRSIDSFSFGNARLDFDKHRAFVDEEEVKLSIKEFDIMHYFVEHNDEVIHRHDLLDEVWGYDVMPTTRTVDNFILDLRKKFEPDPSNPKHIISIRGIGYKFID